jgi:hypothetical protein
MIARNADICQVLYATLSLEVIANNLLKRIAKFTVSACGGKPLTDGSAERQIWWGCP